MPDNRNNRIERMWLLGSVIAWILISGVFLLYFLYFPVIDAGEVRWAEVPSTLLNYVVFAAIVGGVITLQLISIPSRIILNLILAERRRKRLWETVLCIAAFLAICFAACGFARLPG